MIGQNPVHVVVLHDMGFGNLVDIHDDTPLLQLSDDAESDDAYEEQERTHFEKGNVCVILLLVAVFHGYNTPY